MSQMRSLFDVERALAKSVVNASANPCNLTLDDVFDFATVQGARALGQEHRLGSVTAGKEADLLFLDTQSLNMFPVVNPVASVIFHSTISDIDTVLVHGTPVKRGGRLLADLTDVRNRGEESFDHLYWKREDQLPDNAARPHPAVAPTSRA